MYNEISRNKRNSYILILGFILFISALGYFIGWYNGDPVSWVMIAFIISIIYTLVAFFSGDKIALATARAKEIKKENNAYVYNLVENLCIASGLPKPKVYIIPDENINAFATGRDPKHASIAVTAGAINKLDKSELEGVIAHELSHVKNYDIRYMVLVSVLAAAAVLVARFGFYGGGRKRSSNDSGGGIIAILGLVLMIVTPLIAQIIKLAISRQREYLADASAALITRYPDGLASALEKIKHDSGKIEVANEATAHLYISNPFGSLAKGTSKLFSTHPPIDERIKKLREMGR